MLDLPLACRFGAAPPELLACHAPRELPALPARDRFLEDLHATLAALPVALKARIDRQLLGVFYLRGLGSCVVTDVGTADGAQIVGTLVAIDEDALLPVQAHRATVRRAALAYLLEEALAAIDVRGASSARSRTASATVCR
ncbi:hypothetical protein IP91_03602 [Pseudoduganella lurida]|uniref:Uncharacterized protein n=1 Tax=Pseudoduganella lurida TaxID=1036180 RepID=A0A562R5D3_9BURK|nr:hypothetical protein [Pseudoduganella lurida]TWI63630.1 hypothetical protein IP91_03602 [Pseudoduganella lurida]